MLHWIWCHLTRPIKRNQSNLTSSAVCNILIHRISSNSCHAAGIYKYVVVVVFQHFKFYSNTRVSDWLFQNAESVQNSILWQIFQVNIQSRANTINILEYVSAFLFTYIITYFNDNNIHFQFYSAAHKWMSK